MCVLINADTQGHDKKDRGEAEYEAEAEYDTAQHSDGLATSPEALSILPTMSPQNRVLWQLLRGQIGWMGIALYGAGRRR